MIYKIAKLVELDNRLEDKLIQIENLCLDEDNIECIKHLHEKRSYDGYLDTEKLIVGNSFSFNIIWSEVNTLGVYKHKKDYISYNKEKVTTEFYISEIKCFHSSNHLFLDSHLKSIELFNTLINISKHNWEDEDCKHVILTHSDKSVVLDLTYDLDNISEENKKIDAICYLTDVLRTNNEKQKLFINELIDFLTESENQTLALILDNILIITNNANNSYTFYLSNFSAKKLKFEIDSKAIDFSQKICSVINDAQTKLIAIPTAFVLAAAGMDFSTKNILSIKNFVIIISLWIFAFLIHIFIMNQESILAFIKLSIDDFKDTFKCDDSDLINKSFKQVEISLSKQTSRLQRIKLILWIIPVGFSSLILLIYYTINLCTILKTLILPILLCIILVTKILMK